jgi:lactate permease
MGLTQLVVVTAGLWNLGAFMAGIAGFIATIPLANRYRGNQEDNGIFNLRALLVALSGYTVMVVVILIVQLVPIVRLVLGQVVIQVPYPEVSTSLGHITPPDIGRKIHVFRHTGIVLAFASFLAYLIYKKEGLYTAGSVQRILDGTVRRVISSSVSIVSMVTMAVIMEYAGMTDTLALGLAQGLGVIYPFVAPWIGALGAFMTGSNTNSNVVFGGLQLRTAELLGLNIVIILAAQTAGAAIASVMAPTKIVVGASTAGMEGREGDVMRKVTVYVVLLLLLISLMAVIGVRFL